MLPSPSPTRPRLCTCKLKALGTLRPRAAVQMLNSASGEAGSRRPAPHRSRLPQGRAGGCGTYSAKLRETLVLREGTGKLQGRRRAVKGRREPRRAGRAARLVGRPATPNHCLPRVFWPLARVPSAYVFLPPPQQGRSLWLNLSAGLTIHQEPDRQAKFTSNAVNPLQTERLPPEGGA